MTKFFIKNKGFSIVELLLYMGIFTILLTVILQMFGSIFDIQLESQATSSVASDGRYILSRFSYDLSRAQSISFPASPGDLGTQLSIVINGQTFIYSSGSGNLVLQNQSMDTSDQLNSTETSISELSFLRLEGSDGKDAVQVSFTLVSEATQRSGKKIVNFQTTG